MKALKKERHYRLYKVGNGYELWSGKYNDGQHVDIGVRVGYVSDPENFEVACDEADEEYRYLIADLIRE
jgi:hypothetical protein